ncbi:MAG TPA: aldo/keto reductase [Beijerinckiaceae bacterium]|nr:aldo/keto reductase [Beijerinckiaceae bacterium]
MPVPRIRLHASGPELSRLVAGAWRFLRGEVTTTPKELAGFIEGCLALGITSFDHADVYGGYAMEALFGAALKEWGGRRSQIEIVTKCGIRAVNPRWPETRIKHYDTSAAHIRSAVDRSLANFGTDYIDLLLIHRPDPFMDAADCARGLEEVVRAGKVRAVGVSNFAPSQVRLLQSALSLPLVTNQIEYSVLWPDPNFDGTLDQAQELKAAPMIWSPLGGGKLFSDEPSALRVRPVLEALRAKHGAEDIGSIALAWLLMHPSRPVPVLGSTRIDRIAAATGALDVRLDRQDWFAIHEAAMGEPVP